jgi:hypothetical protein
MATRAAFVGMLLAAALMVDACRARACASCSCGDPTLTSVGVEKPYRNRLRVFTEEGFGADSSGSGDTLLRRLVSRTDLGISYTPHPRITLVTFLPFVANLHRGPSSYAHIGGVGDLELQARVLVARDRPFSPRHLFWLLAGIKAPTGPRVFDDRGFPYPDDEQPGSGSWDPFGGATYAWFGGLVSLYSTLVFRYPTTGPRGYRFGPSLISSTVVQLQPWARVAVQLGADLKQAWSDRLMNDAGAPNTGGFIAAVVPGVMVNPWRDLLFRVAVDVPVVQALYGTQSIGPQLIFAVSYDVL